MGLSELLPPTDVELDDSRSNGTLDPMEVRARTLADDARVKTFEMLDERPRAVAIMERRLRAERGL